MIFGGERAQNICILGICGSLQARSRNLSLLQSAAAQAPVGVEVVLFDGLRDLPHFNPDLEQGSALPVVEVWRQALRESAALLIACPEYGFSLPGALKNAIDWVIGTGELERKIVAITAATPASFRGRAGLKALGDTLAAVSAQIIGGEPIVVGASFDADVAALLSRLVQAARTGREEKQ